MNVQVLKESARTLVAGDKGLLAMDESDPTCNKRFAGLGIPQTVEARRAWRELIVTTPGLGECISGAILYDETMRQQKKDGTPFVKALTDAGIVPGVKVDIGAKDLAGHPGEKTTEGLDGLRSVDIRKQRADWNIFRDGCPHGESPAQVSERADRLIAHLRALDGNVALFSHGQFGCVLAARWIGLPLLEARHFALGTASLSILGHDPHHPEVAVIALWNAASGEKYDPMSSLSAGETKTVNPRAIARWENEGGEIPAGAGADLPKKIER